MQVRKASASWKGNLKEGKGTVNTETSTLKDVAYNFVSRFESGTTTNPEELLGAAHSACYSMALAGSLAGAGFKVNDISTEDKIHLQKLDAGWTLTKLEVSVVADVEGIDNETFQKHAEDTKKGCPISRALNIKEVVLTAKLK